MKKSLNSLLGSYSTVVQVIDNDTVSVCVCVCVDVSVRAVIVLKNKVTKRCSIRYVSALFV